MIKCANYVALVYKSSDEQFPNFPVPTLHGWKLDKDRSQAVPTTLRPAPKAVLQLIKCGCKGNCTAISFSCCTDMCASCEAKCENRDIENPNSTADDSDDDDDSDDLNM